MQGTKVQHFLLAKIFLNSKDINNFYQALSGVHRLPWELLKFIIIYKEFCGDTSQDEGKLNIIICVLKEIKLNRTTILNFIPYRNVKDKRRS